MSIRNFQNDDFFPNASIDFTNQFQADCALHKNHFVNNDLSPVSLAIILSFLTKNAVSNFLLLLSCLQG